MNKCNLLTEKITEIYKTYDYNMFINLTGNRELKDGNFRKLINSMSEKQLLIPILVNEKYEIIDGQHRFQACKHLQLPVYFYMVNGYTIEEVKRANLVSCNWNLDDYLHLHCNLNKPDYITFREIKQKYKFQSSQLIEIVAVLENVSQKLKKLEFEEGNFKFNNLMEIETFLAKLYDFKEFKYYNTTNFTKAFLRLYAFEHYDHAFMARRLESFAYKIRKRTTNKEYLAILINEVYTYGVATAEFKYDINADRIYSLR